VQVLCKFQQVDAFLKFSQSVVEVSSLIPCDMCLLFSSGGCLRCGSIISKCLFLHRTLNLLGGSSARDDTLKPGRL
jgi:hypothetical protein